MHLLNLNRKQLNLLLTLTVCLLLSVLAVIVRIPFFALKSGDYLYCLSVWMDKMRPASFKVFKDAFYDYSPLYMYFLFIFSKITTNPLYLMKAFHLFFEFLCAFYVARIVGLKYKNIRIQAAAYLLTLFAPVLILNNAAWGQCDIIFSSLGIASFYYLIKGKETNMKRDFFTFNLNHLISMLFLGVAFSFKFQIIFILPIFFIYLICGRIKFYYFALIPLIYILTILPCVFVGRPFFECLLIYLTQSNNYKALTLNFPNLYYWIDLDRTGTQEYRFFFKPMLILTALLTLIGCLVVLLRRIPLTRDNTIYLAFFFAFSIPFILPAMHERYLFMADVLLILFCFYHPRRAHVIYPLATLVSLAGYFSYLFVMAPVNFGWIAIAYLALIIYLARRFYHLNYQYLKIEPQTIAEENG